MVDDLFKLLGILPQEPDDEESELDVDDSPECPTEMPTDQCLRLDRFDRERGKNALERSTPLNGSVITPSAMADFHGAAFLTDPELLDTCLDKRRHEFLSTLMQTGEYQALRSSTTLDEVASELAAESFGLEYLKLLHKDKETEKKPGKTKSQRERKDLEKEMDLIGAVSAALEVAGEVVDDLSDTMSCLTPGTGPGAEEGKLQIENVRRAVNRIKNSERLKSIINEAGRWIRFAEAKQRQKIQHGLDEVVGITVGGDISKLINSELAMLSDPDLEWESFRRITENQAMVKHTIGQERLGKGPIVICVDESGSMDGDNIVNAKAFALAMARVATRQRRPCVLVGYSGGTQGHNLVLRVGKWSQQDLLTWLEHFYCGGTDMDVPLEKVPQWWPGWRMPKGKTDLILITDGITRIPREMKARFLKWKQENTVKCVSLILNCDAGPLEEVSDTVHRIARVSMRESGIEKCLSL